MLAARNIKRAQSCEIHVGKKKGIFHVLAERPL